MATQLQIRRGTSAQVAAFTGAEGEIVVNTTNDSVHVNDGSTAGGFEMARADLNNVSDTSLNAALTGNTVSALTITTLTLGSTAITATGTEINLLDGVTATTAELNYVDGVTSAIQTQLDAKAPIAGATFTGTTNFAADVTFADGADIITASAGTDNVRLGENAGASIASGGDRNVTIGKSAGTAITTGDRNVAVGHQALLTNTQGSRSVAVGHNALSIQNYGSATDAFNTAVGHEAGGAVTSGTNNTLIGGLAGDAISTGAGNTGLGKNALGATTTASANTAVGTNAMLSNTEGASNVAVGHQALDSDTLGSKTVAVGKNTLQSQNFTTATDSNNVAVGYSAGGAVTTGVGNTFLGGLAGTSSTGSGVDNNTFIGFQAGRYVTSGEKNTVLGRHDGNQGSLDIRTTHNNIVLSDGDGNPRAYYDGGSSYPLWHFVTPTSGQNSINLSHSSASSPYGPAIRFTAVDPNNTTQYFLVGIGNVTARFIVFSNGDVANINNSYGAYSDVKLKENIIDASSQWDDIKALSVRKYSLKQDNLDAPNMLGVIAQEVEAAGVGGLVYESPDKDSENNDLGTVTKQVKYSVLYMKAVKALQEAMERIETLEAKVTALES